MNNRTVRNLLGLSLLLWLGACLSGCGSKIEGKWIGAGNMVTIELKSGKATISDTQAGTTEAADYTVDGDKVTVKSKQGDIVLTYMQDGTLAGPFPLGSFKKAD
jgi:hypothetical protein